MKKKLKLIISSMLTITMALSIVGCSSKNKIEQPTEGRYLSENYELPKDDIFIENVTKLTDGTFATIGHDSNDNVVKYISSDSGKTWTLGDAIELPKVDGKNHYVSDLFMLNDGRAFIHYEIATPIPDKVTDNYIHPESEHKYFIVDTDGSLNEMPISYSIENVDPNLTVSSPYDFKQSNNGDIFYRSPEGNKVVQLDSTTFEEKNVYEYTSGNIDNYTLVNSSLIIRFNNEILEFNTESGKEIGTIRKLEDSIIELSNDDYCRFIDSNSNDKLYFNNILGLYSYDFNTKETKKLIDGSLSIFGDNAIHISSLLENENGDLLVSYNEWDSNGTKLINYSYSADAPSVPTNQLTVYSLYDNDNIRQAVSNFNKVNPDIYAKYEVGLTSQDGVTEGDALRTLNTEIMNNNGPDVILLDALPVDSYIKKGLLEDISDITSQFIEEDLLFKSMVDAYTIENKVYQFPTCFKIPVLVGDKNIIGKINDLNSIKDVSNELSKASDRIIFDSFYDAKTTAYSLYYLYGNKWLNEDNTINEDSLEEFFTTAKEIYTLSQEKMKIYYAKNSSDSTDTDEDEDSYDDDSSELDDAAIYTNMINSLSPSIWSSSLIMQNEPPQLIYGFLDISEFSSLITVLNNDSNIDFKILSRGDDNIFVPLESLGINAKSKNKEAAKEFVKLMLSEKSQKNIRSVGFPVNKQALLSKFDVSQITRNDFTPKFDETTGHYIQGSIGNQSLDGTYTEIDMLFPNEDDVNLLISNIENLNVAPTLNKILLLEVASQFEAYVLGQISIDDAINNVVDNLDLYLSE